MKLKHLTLALTAITAVTILSGCEEESSKTTHAVDINSTEKTVTRLQFKVKKSRSRPAIRSMNEI